jgi:hypothetical protein
MDAHPQEGDIDNLKILSNNHDSRGYNRNDYSQVEPSYGATPLRHHVGRRL